MKKSLIFASVIILTMITSLTNCKQDSVDAPQSILETPKILKLVNQIQYPAYTQIETADYQYDVRGNLIKKSFVIDREIKAKRISRTCQAILEEYEQQFRVSKFKHRPRKLFGFMWF